MLLDFFVKVVVISSSGALSPGPLTASTIGAGLRKGWKAGILVSLGHALVEFPFIVLISLGLYYIIENPTAILVIGSIGSFLLFYLGYLMIKDSLRRSNEASRVESLNEKPLLVGAFLSALNPYFLIWWIFVGGILIIDALSLFGYIGIVILFLMHIWIDFAWLTFISYLGYLGKNILDTRGYKAFLGIIGFLLILFGIDLILSLTLKIHILPF